MTKHFYTHIVSVESVEIEINNMDLSEEEKENLRQLAQSSLHHHVVDTVLSELPEEERKIFLEHLKDENHDKIWMLLKEKTQDIEKKIKEKGEAFLKRLHEDIEESKK